MKVKEIFKTAIDKSIEADFRGKAAIEAILKRKQEKYQRLPEKDKQEFDRDALDNPFLDSRILHLADDREVKKILVGIDIEPAEILLAKELGNIDLIISHHPLGQGLANLHQVMELQCDVLYKYGVPINIAESLMKERISEVSRGINSINHQRTIDTARLLKFNLICLHTVCDNLAAKFIKDTIESAGQLIRLENLLELLKKIPEYQEAMKIGAGPKIFVGDPERRCGKIAVVEITGGTEGSPKLYQKMAQAGIGTVIGMHISEEHKKEAEAANINVVIAGHMSSDSLGVNLFLDELEKKGIEIIPCSGLIRIKRG